MKFINFLKANWGKVLIAIVLFVFFLAAPLMRWITKTSPDLAAKLPIDAKPQSPATPPAV
jgi:hypothetical protein